MSDLAIYCITIILFILMLYIFFKVGKLIFNALKYLLIRTKLVPIDETQLAVATKAKFESLSELEVQKFVMDRTGWTFAKSKSFCDKLKPQTGHALKDKSTEMPQEPSSTLKNHVSKEELEINVREKIAEIGKLETISYIIKNTGWNLKESKTFCDKIEAELSQENQATSQKLTKLSTTKPKADEVQINFIISKTGWAYDKAKAYFEDIQSYEKASKKVVVIKKSN